MVTVNNVAYRICDQLPDQLVGRILDAAKTTEVADGVAPLDEASQLALKNPQPNQHVVTATEGDTVVGFAQMRGANTSREFDCFVIPSHRRQGIASTLWQNIQSIVDDAAADSGAPGSNTPDAAGSKLLAWSHGGVPGSREFAAATGFEATRELWFMTKPHLQDLPDIAVRNDVTLSSFAEGDRVEEFLTVNAQAFSDHPEQGSMSAADVTMRQGEDWYNPSDVILACDPDTGDILGFHWLKVTGNHDHQPQGEVYIIAVSPQAQGRGLGRYLLDVGLGQLAKQHIEAATLYVEKANRPAVALYEAQGFKLTRSHIQYQR